MVDAIDDADLARLVDLPDLVSLWLPKTRVTDAGLAALTRGEPRSASSAAVAPATHPAGRRSAATTDVAGFTPVTACRAITVVAERGVSATLDPGTSPG